MRERITTEQAQFFDDDSPFTKNVLKLFNKSTKAPRVARNLALMPGLDECFGISVTGKALWGEEKYERWYKAGFDKTLKDNTIPPTTPLKLDDALYIPDYTDDTFPADIRVPKSRTIPPGSPVIATGRGYLDNTTWWQDYYLEVLVEQDDCIGQLVKSTQLSPLSEDEIDLFADGDHPCFLNPAKWNAHSQLLQCGRPGHHMGQSIRTDKDKPRLAENDRPMAYFPSTAWRRYKSEDHL